MEHRQRNSMRPQGNDSKINLFFLSHYFLWQPCEKVYVSFDAEMVINVYHLSITPFLFLLGERQILKLCSNLSQQILIDHPPLNRDDTLFFHLERIL